MSDMEREELMGRLRSLEAEVSRLHGTPSSYASPSLVMICCGASSALSVSLFRPRYLSFSLLLSFSLSLVLSLSLAVSLSFSPSRSLSTLNPKRSAAAHTTTRRLRGHAQAWGHDGARPPPMWKPR